MDVALKLLRLNVTALRVCCKWIHPLWAKQQLTLHEHHALLLRPLNQSINQSIFIPPKIKRHIFSYISSWESKNTEDILYTNEKIKIHKTYCIQIKERSKIISKNKPIYKNIRKSFSLYIQAMSSFVFELILCFFLLWNNVTKLAIGIRWTYLEKLLICLF